jgi:hypothetical protein
VTPAELYSLWAPTESAWSPWVLPVPFAQLACPESPATTAVPSFNLDWLPSGIPTDLAIVVDLPGGDAIYYGLALLERGYRPVPVIDGSPGPDRSFILPADSSSPAAENHKSACMVDMRGLLFALCQGAEQLRNARLAPSAPPAFLLDSKRMSGVSYNIDSAFDNRWLAFPQDFPSGRFLRNHGIRKVALVHDTFLKDPQEDLAHVLLRWQEEGIAIESKSARFGDAPVPITVSRPFRFRAAWYRALAALGLRRNDAGGFGGYPPDPSSGG